MYLTHLLPTTMGVDKQGANVVSGRMSDGGFQKAEFLQICSVTMSRLGRPTDWSAAKVIDVMEVDGASGSVLASARSLQRQRQEERENEIVFLRKVTRETRTAYERIL